MWHQDLHNQQWQKGPPRDTVIEEHSTLTARINEGGVSSPQYSAKAFLLVLLYCHDDFQSLFIIILSDEKNS